MRKWRKVWKKCGGEFSHTCAELSPHEKQPILSLGRDRFKSTAPCALYSCVFFHLRKSRSNDAPWVTLLVLIKYVKDLTKFKKWPIISSEVLANSQGENGVFIDPTETS